MTTQLPFSFCGITISIGLLIVTHRSHLGLRPSSHNARWTASSPRFIKNMQELGLPKAFLWSLLSISPLCFLFIPFFPSVIVWINLDFALSQSGWESPLWDDVSVYSLQVCYVIFSRQSPCWMLVAYCSLHKSLLLHCKFRKCPLWAKLWEYKIVSRSVLFQGILNPREVESQERKNVVKSERMKPACFDRQDSSSTRSYEDQGLFSVPYLKSTCWNPNTRPKCQRWGLGEMNTSCEQSPFELG